MRRATIEIVLELEGDMDEDFLGGFGAATVGAARDVIERDHPDMAIKRASWFTEMHELDDQIAPVIELDSGCRFNWKPAHAHKWTLWGIDMSDVADDAIPFTISTEAIYPHGTPHMITELKAPGYRYWWEEVCPATNHRFQYLPFTKDRGDAFDEAEPLP